MIRFPWRKRAALLCVLAAAGCGDGTTDHGPEPAQLVKLAGDGQSALQNTALPESLVVQVLDANGVGVSGVAISWAQVTGGGTFTAAAGNSDGTGRLAGKWNVGPAGPQVLQAQAAGFVVTFNATATSPPPPPTNVLVVATQPANAQSGVAFPTQPAVQLENSLGVPVAQAGVTITASIATGSGFATLNGTATATTNSAGLATFNNLRITGPVGNYTLGFTATGFTSANSTALSLTTVSGRIPLIDMGNRQYHGFPGGLYPGGNTMPPAHAAAGAARARNVVPRDANGNPNANGRIVLMSIGMSNTTQEWCDVVSSPVCTSWSFTGQAGADNAVNHSSLIVVDGAKGSQTAVDWANPASPNYDRIRDTVLAGQGLTEAQVQVIWLKVANPFPTVSLPASNSDAIRLLSQMGDIARVLANRYPSLQMIFVSSRSYAGYAISQLNPEPYAYESGFAVKWLIQAQIDQMANGGTIVDNRPGNLNYNTTVPWLGWGAYLWADGTDPRSDGLTYLVTDFESIDGTHPNTEGETKVGGLLLDFFKTDPRAACWFLAGQTCP